MVTPQEEETEEQKKEPVVTYTGKVKTTRYFVKKRKRTEPEAFDKARRWVGL